MKNKTKGGLLKLRFGFNLQVGIPDVPSSAGSPPGWCHVACWLLRNTFERGTVPPSQRCTHSHEDPWSQQSQQSVYPCARSMQTSQSSPCCCGLDVGLGVGLDHSRVLAAIVWRRVGLGERADFFFSSSNSLNRFLLSISCLIFRLASLK